MNMSDLIQVFLIAAVIFFLLGWAARRTLPRLWQGLQARIFPTRYLKSAGVWVRDGTTKEKTSHHER
ncbi:cellulose biosynthesis protein BcsF [Chimaeribacter californicus]|uniref:Cellulose biosynthesis protein BcsF n=1 Tax=Chimaeribacter californicus TaxID=2060067 RepID=A0A2N5EGW6_9GAMM|nr:cellulose biosynthesis protein BcsF [Chimaeribacter californicus]PLR41778.1 cellulose biosynthesis protein BcsF [Chimaeribacter californicus]